jgi:hypothetical protein
MQTVTIPILPARIARLGFCDKTAVQLIEKQAGWPSYLAKAISKLVSTRAVATPRIGTAAFRGLNHGEAGFRGILHASAHPDIAAQYAMRQHASLPILQQFKIDPTSTLHFTEFGLLSHLRHPKHPFHTLPGRTMAGISKFVAKNPISVVPRSQAIPANYPDWFDRLPSSFRTRLVAPGHTVQYGAAGKAVNPQTLQRALQFETGVTPAQFTNFVAYDAIKRRLFAIPNNIAKDLPAIKSSAAKYVRVAAALLNINTPKSRHLAHTILNR